MVGAGEAMLPVPQAFGYFLKTDNKLNVEHYTTKDRQRLISAFNYVSLTCHIFITLYLGGRVMRKPQLHPRSSMSVHPFFLLWGKPTIMAFTVKQYKKHKSLPQQNHGHGFNKSA